MEDKIKYRTIKRIRYIIMRRDRKDIYCGTPKNYHFKKLCKLRDTAVKTYSTFEQASKAEIDGDFEIVQIEEVLKIPKLAKSINVDENAESEEEG